MFSCLHLLNFFWLQDGDPQLLSWSTSLTVREFTAALEHCTIIWLAKRFSRECSASIVPSYIWYSLQVRFCLSQLIHHCLSLCFSRRYYFKMPRVTRNSQKQIEFRVRKTRSRQKVNEDTINTTAKQEAQASSISPRKRRDHAKGKIKLRHFSFLFHLINLQKRKIWISNVTMSDIFAVQISKLQVLVNCASNYDQLPEQTYLKFPAQATLDSSCWVPWSNTRWIALSFADS